MTPILLISDQTLPNLLFLKQFGPFERYVFITTGKMEQGGKSRWIAQTAGIPEERILRREVEPEQPGSTLEALEGLNMPPEAPILAYVTGGTKMMSLGAYAWASQRQQAQIVYLPIGGTGFLQIFPEPREIPLTAQVSLEEYLAVHGVQVLGAEAWEEHLPEANRVFAHVAGRKQNREVQNRLLEARTSLGELAFPTLSAEQRRFYSGGWLECWLAGQVRDLLAVAPEQIRVSLKLNKSGPSSLMSNEYDVVYCFQNKLFIGECKYYTRPKGFAVSDISRELFKLGGINNQMGLHAKPFFAIVGTPAKDPAALSEQMAILRLKKAAELSTLSDENKLQAYLLSL
jgi:hypothetical protein